MPAPQFNANVVVPKPVDDTTGHPSFGICGVLLQFDTPYLFQRISADELAAIQGDARVQVLSFEAA
jgi:hypothetical protein